MPPESTRGTSFSKRAAFRAAALFLWEFVKVAALAGLTIVLVRYFLFKPFYVKGASMEPNFYDHEYLIIDEITYRLRQPERGEVIVFRYPENPTEYFLKRIIALPGERVKVGNGKVTIYNKEHPEGVVLSESYIPSDTPINGTDEPVLVPPNEYFVMGDNRGNSYDSRRFGPIDKSAIVGRAWLRGWPVSRLSQFGAPTFNF